MLTLRLTRVPENGTLKEDGLTLGLEDVGLADPFDPAGVQVSYELTRMMGKVFGRIQAKAAARQTCGKCLEDYQQALQADFTVTFEARPESVGAEGDPDDPELTVSFFDGEELPLGEEIRQELEMQLPFNPRCRKDCKGLCSQCGQDLNVADCGHAAAGGSGHFDALRDIFTKKKEA